MRMKKVVILLTVLMEIGRRLGMKNEVRVEE
jgi:hypothetical protein